LTKKKLKIDHPDGFVLLFDVYLSSVLFNKLSTSFSNICAIKE
jgi:hypothetical protein